MVKLHFRDTSDFEVLFKRKTLSVTRSIIKGIEEDDFIDEDQYQRTFLEYFEGAFDKNVCDLIETSFVAVNGKKIFRINL